MFMDSFRLSAINKPFRTDLYAGNMDGNSFISGEIFQKLLEGPIPAPPQET